MISFKTSLQKLASSIDSVISQDISLKTTNLDLKEFREKKKIYQLTLFKNAYKDFLSSTHEIHDIERINSKEIISNIKARISLMQENYSSQNLHDLKKLCLEIIALESKLKYQNNNEKLILSIPHIPNEIQSDISADLSELERCFESGCYRASVILCGRLLETALHRKYYEATNHDILEKNPGIGLGTLIAKLKEKNIGLDPAITQQIHLINQVRIYSVHTKKEAFYPSYEQTHAIILYTVDILKKLF